MKNNLFVEAPKGWGMDNALVGGRWASRYAYIHGYYLAASVLAKSALHGEPQDLLFYPICFNYRHCIELQLKALLIEATKLHDVLSKLGEPVKELPPQPKRIMGLHNLDKLLGYVEEILTLFSDEKMNASVKETIVNLNKIDFDGQTFRYEVRMNSKSTLPIETWVDIRNIMKRMKEVHFHLLGIDMWMGDQRQTANDILADMSPDYDY